MWSICESSGLVGVRTGAISDVVVVLALPTTTVALVAPLVWLVPKLTVPAYLATIVCVSTIAITAGYILWRLGAVFFGPLMETWAPLTDAIWRERIAVGLLAAATLIVGVAPNVVADVSAPGVAPIAARVESR